MTQPDPKLTPSGQLEQVSRNQFSQSACQWTFEVSFTVSIFHTAVCLLIVDPMCPTAIPRCVWYVLIQLVFSFLFFLVPIVFIFFLFFSMLLQSSFHQIWICMMNKKEKESHSFVPHVFTRAFYSVSSYCVQIQVHTCRYTADLYKHIHGKHIHKLLLSLLPVICHVALDSLIFYEPTKLYCLLVNNSQIFYWPSATVIYA